ncbi:DUF6492 family protein [Consotaella salsifontis]|uniref:DUF5672 domain-containing protein n=1 Tax=Consotaella salsifontis TaxID=1365950 RepID=A0A1T4Q2Q3_9HYPH|nr:DUF6492 family protein [Consotaella salsifontis]SJZ98080.1 hypothetical protein SAMN05428963_104319 [Consotaella salsifontis]
MIATTETCPPTALVTSSYRGDLARCRLLCESIDRHVTGHSCHYILVEAADVALFKPLEGPRRRIVDERELLPWWLRAFPDPLSFGRRRIWLSPKGPPLRGWHVQQLRRLAFAALMDEVGMISIDSDVVFVRAFDAASFWQGRAFRFFRIPDAPPPIAGNHDAWSVRAGLLLGLGAPPRHDIDYITTLIGWRADTVRDLLARIEDVTGASAMTGLAGSRALSECLLYGRFVDEAEGRRDRHVPTDEQLCRVYWAGEAMGEGALSTFVEALAPHQVAIGIQSFTGTDLSLIRRVAGLE